MKIWARRTVGATLALALVGGLASSQGLPATAQPSGAKGSAAASLATVSTVSAKVTKTDKVKTPKLRWYSCGYGLKCATVKVPRDYDKPKGAKTELALAKRPANLPKKKIGTLFINPGGPGGSATRLAAAAEFIFAKTILDRFDVVGVDPRGIAFSDNLQCFSSVRKQTKAVKGYLEVAFPTTPAEAKAWVKSDKAVGKGCSKRKGLATSMSTAQVARDMEMMRRAVGDKKLSFLGFSYGSYLGQVYANMYPKRFRAIAIDGVLNPREWVGTTKALRAKPVGLRLRSGEGAWKALREILVRCKRVGTTKCDFASGDPVAKFTRLTQRLKQGPVVVEDDGDTYVYTFDGFIADLLGSLYDPDGWDYIVYAINDLYSMAFPPDADRATPDATHKRIKRLAAFRKFTEQLRRPSYDFPYDNSKEAGAAVLCTDSRENTKSKKFQTTYLKDADRTDPGFSRAWMWLSSICAKDAYTGNDEDAYRGPFNRRTKAPVLVVGSWWDPATNYEGALAAANLLPNSKLVPNNSWGHVSYGTSKCVTNAIDSYLLTGKVQSSYAPCRGDSQPFESSDEEVERSHQRTLLLVRAMGGLR